MKNEKWKTNTKEFQSMHVVLKSKMYSMFSDDG